MKTELIPSFFGIKEVQSIVALDSGHINRTYLVSAATGKYIIQALNSKVFPRPETVMSNISRIESVLSECTDIRVPHLLRCGKDNYLKTDDEIWRMYCYCEGQSFENDLYLTGYSFGRFISVMSSSGVNIESVIDGFHNFNLYYSKLEKYCKTEDIPDIFIALKEDLNNCFEGLPDRIIHGDAKTDNIIVGRPCTILDLDTVMTGPAALDYGDMIRSVCSQEINIDAIRELTKGFMNGTGELLTEKEKSSLFSGILWVTGELALRYFTDYHSEERYFVGKTRKQCLDRSRQLLKQLDAFITKKNEIIHIITAGA